MYLGIPIWHLKEECPCCNQSSALELYTCDKCCKMIAICDEMMTNFLDPLKINIPNIAKKSNNEDCPHCFSKNCLRPSKNYYCPTNI